MKETFKIIWIKVKAWCLALMANLWEDYLKEELREQIDKLIVRGVNLVHVYHDSEAYEVKKESIINFIFKNIKLPILLKPFKGIIRNILSDFIEKQVDKALGLLDKIQK